MPLHDWSRIPAGLFHHFHQHWSIEIAAALNRGRLPDGLSALVEQRVGSKEPDLLAIEEYSRGPAETPAAGAVIAAERPMTRFVRRSSRQIYATRANRIVVRHHLGRVVAVIEIVSPGNKESRSALRDFVDKAIDFLRQGVHVLIIDLLPPTPRDPQGIHKVVWDEITEEDFQFPEGKDRTLVSYDAGPEKIAYIEPVGLGEALPDMPLILTSKLHTMVPLESTYVTSWEASPAAYRHAIETGEISDAGGVS